MEPSVNNALARCAQLWCIELFCPLKEPWKQFHPTTDPGNEILSLPLNSSIWKERDKLKGWELRKKHGLKLKYQKTLWHGVIIYLHPCNEKEIQSYVSGMFQLTARKYHSQEPSQDLVLLSMSMHTRLPCSYLVQVNAAESLRGQRRWWWGADGDSDWFLSRKTRVLQIEVSSPHFYRNSESGSMEVGKCRMSGERQRMHCESEGIARV